MQNQRSLDNLANDPQRWLDSRWLKILGAPGRIFGQADYFFGSESDGTDGTPGAANAAERKGWLLTETDFGTGKAKGARWFSPTAGMVREPVPVSVVFLPVSHSDQVDLTSQAFAATIVPGGAARFLVTTLLNGCSFAYDPGSGRIAHVMPRGQKGSDLCTALAGVFPVLYGAGREYGNEEDVTVLGVWSGSWTFFAQVHAPRATHRISRVDRIHP